MAKNTDQAFESIRIVGGLISSKVLQDARRYDLPGQSKEHYQIEPGLTFNDDIGRYWRIAQARWQEFQLQCQRQDVSSHTIAQLEWLIPLLEKVLGYRLEITEPVMLGEREFPITHTAFNHAVPFVLCGAEYDLDKGDAIFGQEGRKRSPMGLLQEYLNAESTALWAIVSNGLVLRLLRDNPAMTRPAYIEVDFARMFEEDNYADFATLWLTLHATRLEPQNNHPEQCWIEQWRGKGQDEGERALDKLRYGVADALRQLGTGFVAHKNNQTLRDKLSNGELTTEAYFQQVLRLVYRFLFLLTAEDRNVALLPEEYEGQNYAKARKLYEQGYSLTQLRDKARLKRHYDTYGDAWHQLLITFTGFAQGQPLLAQPALGGLFAKDQCADLEVCELQNRYLFSALFNLCYFEHDRVLARINYRDMDTEEFGSVYESLLELIPQLSTEGIWSFSFMGDAVDEESASGHSRKLTGSYYTPDALVQELIQSALEPIIVDRLKTNPQQPREAILSITVCDPACGSGHFLLAAARRLAAELAKVDSGSDQATEEHYRHAMRDVVRHCIYGVDINPMAVELCKTGLWLESIESGKPLTFMDAYIQCGNAVIGLITPELMNEGIPQEAYTALPGDDKDVCQSLKKRNANAEIHARHQDLFSEHDTPKFSDALKSLENMPEENIEDVSLKHQQWKQIQSNPEFIRESLRADCFVTAFLAEKNRDKAESIPATEDLLALRDKIALRPTIKKHVTKYALRYKPFHWYLRFPEVISSGGFDLVLGNPPWKPMSPDYKEFFETFESSIRFLTPDEQKETYDRLLSIPTISARWNIYCRDLFASVHCIKRSGRYRMFAPGNLGKGDFNIYRMFVELALSITRSGAVAAQLVPEGLYNGANASAIREELFNQWELKLIGGFENTKGIWFPAVHNALKFCMYVAVKRGRTEKFSAAFRINSREKLISFSSGKVLDMPVALVEEFSPDAKAIMEFSSQIEIDICEKMYSIYPKLGQDVEGFPFRNYSTEIHMGNDRELFCVNNKGIPVYEGRMIGAYDYRASGYVSGRGRAAVWESYRGDEKKVKPQWFIEEGEIPEKVTGVINKYRIGFCNITSPTNSRSLIATMIPKGVVCGHSIPVIHFNHNSIEYNLLFLAVCNSLVMDFLVRKKVSLNMTYTVLDSLPFPRSIIECRSKSSIIKRVYQLVAIGEEMAELRLNAMENKIVTSGTKTVLDPEERHRISCEIDALVARDIYGLNRRQMLYVLDPKNIEGVDSNAETFKALRNREVREFDEYRTQRLIMEAWDKLEAGTLDTLSNDIELIGSSEEFIGIKNVPDNDWQRPGADLQAETALQLAAILRKCGDNISIHSARLALLVAMEPRTLVPFLNSEQQAEWLRLNGSDAAPLNSGITRLQPNTQRHWGEAIRQLRGNGLILENLQARTWSPGKGLNAFPSQAWAEGRARFVMAWLNSSVTVADVVSELPQELRGWLNENVA